MNLVLAHLFNSANLANLQLLSNLAAAALITIVWQSAVIAGALALALKLLPRTTAALRFSLWITALGFILALPVLSFIPFGFGSLSLAAAPFHNTASKPLMTFDARWSIALVLLWAFSSLYRLADISRHALVLRKLWKSANPVGNNPVLGTATDRRVQLCTTTELERPAVIGFFSPRILIPEWLYARLTASELNQIILHETEHLRRHDDWTNLLQKLSLTLFPLNPVLHWIDRRLATEREMACDDGVVLRTKAPSAYATCLANLAEHSLRNHSRRVEALSLGAWQHRSELTRRIHSILARSPRLSPAATSALILGFGVTLALGSAELARCPQLIAFAGSHTLDTIATHSAGLNSPRALRTAYESGVQRSTSHFHPQLAVFKTGLPGENRHNQLNLHHQAGLTQLNNPKSEMVSPRFAAVKTREVAGSPNLSRQADNARLSQTQPIAQVNQVDPIASEDQYVVLTTWEQVSYPAAPNSSHTDQINPEAEYRTTITRMIVHLIPATFKSTSPASGPADSRWFVFQL